MTKHNLTICITSDDDVNHDEGAIRNAVFDWKVAEIPAVGDYVFYSDRVTGTQVSGTVKRRCHVAAVVKPDTEKFGEPKETWAIFVEQSKTGS